jgi:hypothetical protein
MLVQTSNKLASRREPLLLTAHNYQSSDLVAKKNGSYDKL